MNLLWRGSEKSFDPRSMHEAVDGISPILLLVRTDSARKIGAYLNCKLNSREDWISDVSGLSFIFSIDKEEGYRLKAEAQSRLKAAFGGAKGCLLYTSPSPRDLSTSRMPSSA